jgi:hypothetical protein
MDPNRKITKIVTKKFDSKVINRQYFHRKTGLKIAVIKKSFDHLQKNTMICFEYVDAWQTNLPNFGFHLWAPRVEIGFFEVVILPSPRSNKNLVKTQNHTLKSAGASSRPKSGKEARSARSARIHSATSQDRRKSQAGMGGVSGEEYQV